MCLEYMCTPLAATSGCGLVPTAPCLNPSSESAMESSLHLLHVAWLLLIAYLTCWNIRWPAHCASSTSCAVVSKAASITCATYASAYASNHTALRSLASPPLLSLALSFTRPSENVELQSPSLISSLSTAPVHGSTAIIHPDYCSSCLRLRVSRNPSFRFGNGLLVEDIRLCISSPPPTRFTEPNSR